LFEQLSLLVTVIGQSVLCGGTWLEDFINVQVFGVRHLRLLHLPLSLLARSCLPAQLSHIVASIVWCVDGTPGETVAPKSLTDRGGEAMDQTVGTHTPAVTVGNEGRQGEQ
jgi:hypothetical protein